MYSGITAVGNLPTGFPWNDARERERERGGGGGKKT